MKIRRRRSTILNARPKPKRKPVSPLRADPSRTHSIRQRFERALVSRFERLKRSIKELIADEDALGLKPEPNNPFALNTRWQFKTSDEQLKAFEDWLKTQVQADITGSGDAFWEAYIKEAYAKGQGRVFDDLNRRKLAAGMVNLDFYNGTRDAFLRSTFNHPGSAESVKLLASRAYSNLNGITDAMGTQIKRILVDGMIQGANPNELAKRINQAVDGIGINRARTLARSEVMHAHAEAQLDAFERLGVDTIGVTAEISTAGDGRVCKICQPLEGVVLKVKESRGLLPRHPGCRCIFTPSNVGETKTGQRRTKPTIDSAFKKSIAAEVPKAQTIKEARTKSRWQGAGKHIAKDRPVSILDKVSPKPKTPDQAKAGKVKVNGVLRQVYLVDGVRYVKDAIPGSRDLVVIIADLSKLDKLWRQTSPGFYIPEGGGGAEIGGRRDEFERFLEADPNRPIQMPRVVVVKEADGSRTVSFANGRHRFSIMRDKHGKEFIAVQVERSAAADAKRLFGTL